LEKSKISSSTAVADGIENGFSFEANTLTSVVSFVLPSVGVIDSIR